MSGEQRIKSRTPEPLESHAEWQRKRIDAIYERIVYLRFSNKKVPTTLIEELLMLVKDVEGDEQ